MLASILLVALMIPSSQMEQSQSTTTSINEKTFPIPFGIDVNPTSTSLPSTSQGFAKPIAGMPLPENGLRTSNGGFITIPRPLDDNGKPLNVIYEENTIQYPTGPIVPACRGPSPGLYQEGNSWTVTSNSNTIGASGQWNLPTGTINSGSDVGIYYNPVNFWVTAATPLHDYDFFQVTYGIGNNLSLGPGWKMIFSQLDSNGNRIYPYISMSGIPVVAGGSYRVDSMLQPLGLANPPAYVVQVTYGGNAWVYNTILQSNYPTIKGSMSLFSSYNDEWLKSHGGSTNYLSDTNSNPQIMKDVNNVIAWDPTLVTGLVSSDTNKPIQGQPNLQTWDILSPSPLNTKPYNDLQECSSW